MAMTYAITNNNYLVVYYAQGYSEYGQKVQGGFLPGHLSRDTGVRPFLLLINSLNRKTVI